MRAGTGWVCKDKPVRKTTSSSYYRVRNLLPGPSTICRLHEGNHITFTYTASWLREEKRAVICKRPTERGRDEIVTIDAFKGCLHLHLCPMFPAVAGCIEGHTICSIDRYSMIHVNEHSVGHIKRHGRARPALTSVLRGEEHRSSCILGRGAAGEHREEALLLREKRWPP